MVQFNSVFSTYKTGDFKEVYQFTCGLLPFKNCWSGNLSGWPMYLRCNVEDQTLRFLKNFGQNWLKNLRNKASLRAPVGIRRRVFMNCLRPFIKIHISAHWYKIFIKLQSYFGYWMLHYHDNKIVENDSHIYRCTAHRIVLKIKIVASLFNLPRIDALWDTVFHFHFTFFLRIPFGWKQNVLTKPSKNQYFHY